MTFWERVKSFIRKENTTQGWLAKESNLNIRTMEGWIMSGRIPSAEDTYQIARNLHTTVEELVAGDEGRQYVIKWAGDNAAEWHPPKKIEKIVDDLLVLEENDLKSLAKQIKGLANEARSENEASANGSSA